MSIGGWCRAKSWQMTCFMNKKNGKIPTEWLFFYKVKRWLFCQKVAIVVLNLLKKHSFSITIATFSVFFSIFAKK